MKRVLYAEDSATAQAIMRKYLDGLCLLTITPSTQGAMKLLAEQPFDLLIADYIFPDGDALNLIHHVHRSPATTAMPIIVVSGSMDGPLLNKVLKAGAHEGFAKPLNPAEFRTCVERMLNEPYRRTLESGISGVGTFQWSCQGKFFEFSPELDLTVSGADREEVSRKMEEALHNAVTQKIALGFTTHERIVTHLVRW